MLRYYEFKNGNVLIGGIPAIEIAKKYGTPLYLYDEEILQKKADLLRANIPSQVDLFFSVKANPNIYFLDFFKKRNVGCEVASAGEMILAISAGVPASDIIFAGPGKDRQELEMAIEKGIYAINVESIEELELINEIAKKIGKTANIGVRINPLYSIKGSKITMGGKTRQFGIDEDRLDPFFMRLKTMDNIHFRGIHVYLGTLNLDHEIFLKNLHQIASLAVKVSKKYNITIEMINFGGGIGVPYYQNDKEFDIVSLGLGFRKLVSEIRAEFSNQNIRLMIEPGRYLAAESGIYLTKVLYIKESRKKTFIITDGGMHQFQQIGQVIKKNFPIHIINKTDQERTQTVNIAGRLCTSIDIIAENVLMPEIEPGDIVAVYKTGAYGFSAAPTQFLSHPSAKEVFIKDGKDLLVRESIGIKQIMKFQQGYEEHYSSAT